MTQSTALFFINIAAELSGREATTLATWNAICLADMGDTGAAFVALPQIPPRNVTWFKKGKWVHQAKIGFEKYFLRKMKKGNTDPIFERFILKALGINKLEDTNRHSGIEGKAAIAYQSLFTKQTGSALLTRFALKALKIKFREPLKNSEVPVAQGQSCSWQDSDIPYIHVGQMCHHFQSL